MNICLNVGIGCGKNECEDTALFNNTLVNDKVLQIKADCVHCIGVADGVGGNAGGRIASRYVAHEICQADFSSMVQQDLQNFVFNINTKLINYAMSIPDKSDMATTLTCLVAAKDGYYLIHAGNTRLYVMQGSYLKQVTADHTTYNWLIECGQYESAEFCRKSEITCCFGGGTQQYANRFVIEKVFDEYFPDTLVLTSDGIHDFVELDYLENTLSSDIDDTKATQSIAEKARKNGSTDDTTIIILRR